MEHDAHQNKVLALGITLLISMMLIVFAMHDADANAVAGRLLIVRDAPASEPKTLASRAENSATLPRADGERGTLQDPR